MSDDLIKDIQDAINKGNTSGNNNPCEKIDFPDPTTLQHGLNMDKMTTPEHTNEKPGKNKK